MMKKKYLILKWMILNVDFALKLSNSTPLKLFFMSQMNPKNFSTILHSQFNYYIVPVTPFKQTVDVTSDPPF